MKQDRPASFPQSASMLGMVSGFCPAGIAGCGPVVVVKRAKGSRLHTLDGCILHDFWLDAGRLPFGHAPAFLGQIQKNHVSTGSLAGYPQPVHFRLLARLARLLPGYTLQFADRADMAGLEPVPHELDLTRTAFTDSSRLLPENEHPPRIRLNGALGLDVIASRTGLEVGWYWPDAILTARALGLLTRMLGPHAPWASCAERADRFARSMGTAVRERRSASVRIVMDEQLRASLLAEGLYAGGDGWIYFCTEHDLRTVDRLSRTLLHLKETRIS